MSLLKNKSMEMEVRVLITSGVHSLETVIREHLGVLKIFSTVVRVRVAHTHTSTYTGFPGGLVV